MSKRPTTMYDASAGRRTANGFLPEKFGISARSATSQHIATHPRNPRKGSLRDNDGSESEDAEINGAVRNVELPAKSRDLVPDTDLLEALHGYTSDFYGVQGRDTDADWGSLDETALLTIGVLVEEQIREIMGSEGDMVFTEEEDVQPMTIEETTARQPQSFEKTDSGHQNNEANIADAKLLQRWKEGAGTQEHKREKKRRRMEHGDAYGEIADV